METDGPLTKSTFTRLIFISENGDHVLNESSSVRQARFLYRKLIRFIRLKLPKYFAPTILETKIKNQMVRTILYI